MIKLKIININNYEYTLEDNKNNKYNITIEFYDINELPKVGDYIYMSNRLLNEKMLAFGTPNSVYGKKIINDEDEDIIVLQIQDKKLYLQRYYG